MLNSNIKLQKIKDISWNDVFEYWRHNEEDNLEWKKLWLSRGYDSWRNWRLSYANELELQNKKWELFEIIDPVRTIPNFMGGMFKGWQKEVYGNKKTLVFIEIAKSTNVLKNKKIISLTENFPKETYLIGLNMDDDVYVLEGMHRCSAVSVLSSRGKELDDRKIYIAIARHDSKCLLNDVAK